MRTRWTEELVCERVLLMAEPLGRMPTQQELRSSPGLMSAVTSLGGSRGLAKKLGLRMKGVHVTWSDDVIAEHILPHAKRLSRMPSSQELRAVGDNSLACAISKHGGFRHWATQLGLETKSSETKMGQKWEDHEAEFFGHLGFDVVQQSTKSPYDMTVGQWRVDVKAAHWTEHGSTKGFVFAGLKHGRDAQYYDLLCISEGEAITHRFMVPDTEITGSMLVLSKASLTNDGGYSRWAGVAHLLNLYSGMAA